MTTIEVPVRRVSVVSSRPKILRLIVGNPLIMREMAKTRSRRGGVRAYHDPRRRTRRWRAPVVRLDGEPARSVRESGSSPGGQRSRREDRGSARDGCAMTDRR